MKIKKKIVSMVMAVVMVLALTACENSDKKESSNSDKITIAYQSSIAYAPFLVMKDQKLIEKYYDGDLEVDWKMLANGSAINEGMTAGRIDVGAMGLAPAITGVKTGIPYKIYSGISAQPYGVLTNQKDIKTLKDITEKDQVAITNINSHPHILLAMAAKAYLGDAHALDSSLVVLSNPDGYSSMITGAVQCHMVISPYKFMEEAAEGIHEVEIGDDVWPDGNTFIVGVATTELYENKKLYEDVCKATDEAMIFIKENPEATAKILKEGYDASEEDILGWMKDDASDYMTTLQGVMDFSKFMETEGFIDKGPEKISEITYDNVKGN